MADHDLALLRLTRHDWTLWTAHLQGDSVRAIAEREGIDERLVRKVIRTVRASFTPEDLDEIRRDHLEELRMLSRKMWDLVEMNGSPVTSGKDGRVVLDPDTGEVVRDHSGRIAATGMLLKLQERAAKIVGSDAPVKAELAVRSESIDGELMELARQLGVPVEEAPAIAAEAERLDEQRENEA